MQQGINITDDEIRYTEQLLLPDGKEFDDERKEFIRDFRILDLQAVPGSGKTTALLAKLIILERKLPFADGSGILVLSHTNVAIDEIKEKIQKHCPKLFSYPNFIGTIQSFVDEFLAIPFYISKFKKKPNRIDNEIYDETINKYLKFNLRDFTVQEQKNAKYFLIGNNCQFSYRFAYQNNETKLVSSIDGDELQIIKPRRGKNWQDFLDNDKNRIREWLVKFKYLIMQKEGTLHFDDAYFLADVYLSKIPAIKNILQKRFSLVFVDEMQDMDTHQCNLLEKIFYDDGNSISKIQRIGDKNQAIYNSVKASDVWNDRETVLRLNGSQRLSKPIADVVKKFALYSDETFDIVGKNECEIKPHLLVFENTTIENIIPRFAQIVKEYKTNGRLISKKDFKDIKIVCWNTDWKEDDTSRQDTTKLRLEDYHKGFKKEKGKPKQDYDNLKCYLLYYEKKQTLEPIRKNILNAFLKIFRLENINTSDNRLYTKKKLIDFVREADIEKYDELNLNLYNWSIGIIQAKTNEVLDKIREYLPILLAIFDKTISTTSDFINNENVEIPAENAQILTTTNHYKEDGLEIEITSVHAVKGQTHCATLYLESYFQKDGNGANAKSYESQRLAQQFLGMQIQSNVGNRIKQSAKMAYVGFSRPTDLLCIAVHKDRFDNQLDRIDRDIWEIITV
jgi:DNA helicase-2/ATP-dependent DNA helicase PcrA